MIVEHKGKVCAIQCSKSHCFRGGRRCEYYDEEFKRCKLFDKNLPIDSDGMGKRLPDCKLKEQFPGRGRYQRITDRSRGHLAQETVKNGGELLGVEDTEGREITYQEVYLRLLELENIIEDGNHDA